MNLASTFPYIFWSAKLVVTQPSAVLSTVLQMWVWVWLLEVRYVASTTWPIPQHLHHRCNNHRSPEEKFSARVTLESGFSIKYQNGMVRWSPVTRKEVGCECDFEAAVSTVVAVKEVVVKIQSCKVPLTHLKLQHCGKVHKPITNDIISHLKLASHVYPKTLK